MTTAFPHIVSEMIREVRRRKWLALLVFLLVSAAVLAAGFFWRYKYESQVVIFVDDSNIIKPLMQGSAVTTEISDRVSAAKTLLDGRDLLSKVATDTQIWGPEAQNLSQKELDQRISTIRSNFDVIPLGHSYFGIRYSGHEPQRVYLIAQRMGQLFISNSEARKKEESKNAYDFINKQVKSYEQQLQQSQENLKNFETRNTDGTEHEANQKLADLRGKIELAQLDLQEAESQKTALEKQLKGVGQTINQGQTEDIYQSRINNLQQKLDNLKLQYKDSYPDIVNLKQQIKELQKQHAKAQKDNTADQVTQGQNVINPLYQTLRSQLANASAKIDSVQTRLKVLNHMLDNEQQRMKRIQAHKAEYAELTRGMQVNKQIYDDLLKRRETARVSMRLNLDGQGLRYVIQESAQYPTTPSGLKFKMFAAAGLFLGLFAPFGVAAGFVKVDPRVRDRDVVEADLNIPVLTVIPEVRTPFEHRQDRRRTWIIAGIAVLCVGGYLALTAMHLVGVV